MMENQSSNDAQARGEGSGKRSPGRGMHGLGLLGIAALVLALAGLPGWLAREEETAAARALRAAQATATVTNRQTSQQLSEVAALGGSLATRQAAATTQADLLVE